MKLKFVYDNETDIPETAKEFYEQSNGKWQLATEESLVPKDKLDTFRNDAIAARKDRDRYKAIADQLEIAGITPELAIELKGRSDDLQAEKLMKKGEIDKVVADRLAMEQKKFEKLVTAEKERVSRLTSEIEVMRIDEAAVAIALKHGLHDTAVDDVKSRARGSFVLQDGKLHQRLPDGTIDPTTDDNVMEEWVKEKLKPNASHLFKGNAGGGGSQSKGSPSRSTVGESGPNPWSKDTFNLTQQGKIARENPAKAKQLMETASTG